MVEYEKEAGFFWRGIRNFLLLRVYLQSGDCPFRDELVVK